MCRVFILTDVRSTSLFSTSESSSLMSFVSFCVFLSFCVFVFYEHNMGVLTERKLKYLSCKLILLFLCVSEASLTLFFVGVPAVLSSGEYWRRLGARAFRDDLRTGPSRSTGVISCKVCIINNHQPAQENNASFNFSTEAQVLTKLTTHRPELMLAGVSMLTPKLS